MYVHIHSTYIRNYVFLTRWVNYTKTQKINAHVNFDFELNLSDFCVTATPTTPGNVTAIPSTLGNSVTDGDNNQENMYDLVSVIMHHGTGFGSGHYSSYCWNNIAGKCVCVCVCMYVCMYLCTYVCTYIHTHTKYSHHTKFTYICTYIRMYVNFV